MANKFDTSKLGGNQIWQIEMSDKQKWQNNSANLWQIKEKEVLKSGSGNIQAYYLRKKLFPVHHWY